MEKKYVVPEGGLKAAFDAGETTPHTIEGRVTDILEAFIRWQSENPPEITNEMKKRADKYSDGHPWPEYRYAFTVAYLSPEPEVPEAVKDLLWERLENDGRDVKDHNKYVLEAFRRGKESK
jgi:hypothetical protein